MFGTSGRLVGRPSRVKVGQLPTRLTSRAWAGNEAVTAQDVKLLIPGSVSFLLYALAVGVILLHGPPHIAAWGRRALVLLLLLYWALATPMVAEVLMWGLRGGRQPLEDSAVAAAPAIVVLGSGVVTYASRGIELHQFVRRTAFSILEAVRLERTLPAPWVIVSGGVPDTRSQRQPEAVVLRDALLQFGVDGRRVLLEPSSRNTREQALAVAALLRERAISRFILVTSPLEMKRATALFRALQLDPIPSMSGLDYASDRSGIHRLYPSLDALRGSESAAYEYMALAYYRLRGWL